MPIANHVYTDIITFKKKNRNHNYIQLCILSVRGFLASAGFCRFLFNQATQYICVIRVTLPIFVNQKSLYYVNIS